MIILKGSLTFTRHCNSCFNTALRWLNDHFITAAESQYNGTYLCLVLWLSPPCSSLSFSMLSMASLQARLAFLHAVWLLETTDKIKQMLKTAVCVLVFFIWFYAKNV